MSEADQNSLGKTVGRDDDVGDTGGKNGVNQNITCAGCGSVYDRRYLTECCRYEAGQGYRCPVCNHFLERESEAS